MDDHNIIYIAYNIRAILISASGLTSFLDTEVRVRKAWFISNYLHTPA